MSDKETFLARWSRIKTATEAQPAAAPATPVPELPPIESLTAESDFSVFMHPKVDPKLRRAALKKLFSDPHFNVMDGLDVYIDDYTKSDPIPEEMLAQMVQMQNLFGVAEQKKEAPEAQAKDALPLESGGEAAPGEQTKIPEAAEPAATPAPAVGAVSKPDSQSS